jgi:hypothetical protein
VWTFAVAFMYGRDVLATRGDSRVGAPRFIQDVGADGVRLFLYLWRAEQCITCGLCGWYRALPQCRVACCSYSRSTVYLYAFCALVNRDVREGKDACCANFFFLLSMRKDASTSLRVRTAARYSTHCVLHSGCAVVGQFSRSLLCWLAAPAFFTAGSTGPAFLARGRQLSPSTCSAFVALPVPCSACLPSAFL